MFRTARITFQEAGHEPVTDLFRVFVSPDQQDNEVRLAVHDGGFRDFQILSWSFTD
jgi:hypothetical protein